jgi:dienelactone hydrolase
MTVPRIALAGLFLLLACLVVIVLVFIPRRPSPAGPHAVGRLEVVLQDSRGRPLLTTVWYPAEGSRGGVLTGAPLAAAAPAPVILYSPGWGGTRAQSSVQAENLASHGFVVVGCDDIASDPAIDPDRGRSIELGSDAALAETIERGGRHVLVQAHRLLDALGALEAGKVPSLAGRLDPTRIGAMGYSVGGAVVVQAGLLDHRIAAVLNIDGALLGAPADQIGPQAYLLLSSREAFPTEGEANSAEPSVRNYAHLSLVDIPRNMRRLEGPNNYWVMIGSADHDDLSDGLFALRRNRLFRTNFSRSAMNEYIGRLEVAYFRDTLLGDHAALRDLAGKDHQNVRWISSTSPMPGTARARQ